MNSNQVIYAGLTASVILLTAGLVLFRYRLAVSIWAIEMRKVYKSFLIRKGNLAEINIIAILLIILGLGFSMVFIFYLLYWGETEMLIVLEGGPLGR